MDVALGLKARTGRAVLVALGGTPREPLLVERTELWLVPAGVLAPYHAAVGLEPAKARVSVSRGIAAAHRLAATGIREATVRLAASGHTVRRCGVLVGAGMPPWSTDEILAVHVRMHQAEGELFRDVLVAGARACGLCLTTLPDKSALDVAANMLGASPDRLAEGLMAMGRAAGPPWGKDQKEAAAAALAALGSGRHDPPP